MLTTVSPAVGYAEHRGSAHPLFSLIVLRIDMAIIGGVREPGVIPPLGVREMYVRFRQFVQERSHVFAKRAAQKRPAVARARRMNDDVKKDTRFFPHPGPAGDGLHPPGPAGLQQ